MAQSAQVNKVSIKHDAILDFLVANPTLKRSEVAGYFGVTVPWLSVIIHSDVFQELLKQRQDLIFDVAVVRPIQEKLMGTANLAIEKLMESLQFETDTKTLNTVLDTTLSNLGYGQKNQGHPVNQQNNITLNVSKEDLSAARELIGQARAPRLESPTINGEESLSGVYIPAKQHSREEE